MKTIFIVFLLVLPLILAATIPLEELTEEEIQKRISLGTIVGILKSLGIQNNCIGVCQRHVSYYWSYLCKAACRMVLG